MPAELGEGGVEAGARCAQPIPHGSSLTLWQAKSLCMCVHVHAHPHLPHLTLITKRCWPWLTAPLLVAAQLVRGESWPR